MKISLAGFALVGLIAGLGGEVFGQTLVKAGDSGTIEYPIENVAPSDGPFEGVTVSVISIDPAFASYVTTTPVAAQDIAVGQTATFSIPYQIAANAPDGSFTMVLHVDAITVGSTPDLTDSSRDASVNFTIGPIFAPKVTLTLRTSGTPDSAIVFQGPSTKNTSTNAESFTLSFLGQDPKISSAKARFNGALIFDQTYDPPSASPEPFSWPPPSGTFEDGVYTFEVVNASGMASSRGITKYTFETKIDTAASSAEFIFNPQPPITNIDGTPGAHEFLLQSTGGHFESSLTVSARTTGPEYLKSLGVYRPSADDFEIDTTTDPLAFFPLEDLQVKEATRQLSQRLPAGRYLLVVRDKAGAEARKAFTLEAAPGLILDSFNGATLENIVTMQREVEPGIFMPAMQLAPQGSLVVPEGTAKTRVFDLLNADNNAQGPVFTLPQNSIGAVFIDPPWVWGGSYTAGCGPPGGIRATTPLPYNTGLSVSFGVASSSSSQIRPDSFTPASSETMFEGDLVCTEGVCQRPYNRPFTIYTPIAVKRYLQVKMTLNANTRTMTGCSPPYERSPIVGSANLMPHLAVMNVIQGDRTFFKAVSAEAINGSPALAIDSQLQGIIVKPQANDFIFQQRLAAMAQQERLLVGSAFNVDPEIFFFTRPAIVTMRVSPEAAANFDPSTLEIYVAQPGGAFERLEGQSMGQGGQILAPLSMLALESTFAVFGKQKPPPQPGRGLTIKADASNNLWVVASNADTVSLDKYDSQARFISSTALPNATEDGFWTITLDGTGNAYAVGSAAGTLAVFKVDAQGALVSNAAYQTGIGAQAVALEAGGDFWISGVLVENDIPRLGLWRYCVHNNSLTLKASYARGGGFDAGYGVRVLGADVWVAGYSNNPAPAPGELAADLALWHFNSSGALLGGPYLQPGFLAEAGNDDVGAALELSQNRLYIAATKQGPSSKQLEFLKYDLSGQLQVERSWTAASGASALPRRMISEPSGDVLIAGAAGGSAAVWKYRPDASLISAQGAPGVATAAGITRQESGQLWLAVRNSSAPFRFEQTVPLPGTDVLVFDGGGNNGSQADAQAIAADSLGNLWMVNRSNADHNVLALAKYDALGAPLSSTLLPNALGDFSSWSLNFDAQGQVYVVGTARGAETGESDVTVYKANTSGVLLSSAGYHIGVNSHGLTFDSTGDIWITGAMFVDNQFNFGLWKYCIHNNSIALKASYARGGGLDGGLGVRLVGSDIWVAGFSQNPNPEPNALPIDLALWRFSLSGELLAPPIFEPGILSGVDNTGLKLEAGPDALYVATTKEGSSSKSLAFLKYDLTGKRLVERAWTASSGLAPLPGGITRDAQGNILVAGSLQGPHQDPLAFWRYGADAGFLSAQTVEGIRGANGLALKGSDVWLAVNGKDAPFRLEGATELAGADVLISSVSVVTDTTSPVTTLVIGSPQVPFEGSLLLSGLTPLSFSAVDPLVNETASGVKLTRYQIDGGDFTVYSGSFSLTAPDGAKTIAFSSQDNALNEEAQQSRSVLLDSTTPEASISCPSGGQGVCAVIQGKVAVFGTARDAHLASYLLEVSNGAGFTMISSGSAAASGEVLGYWDASNLTGPKILRLTAVDLVQNATVVLAEIYVGEPAVLLTVAGFDKPEGTAVGANGAIYVADTKNDQILVLTSTGAVAARFSGVKKPAALAVDAGGNIFVADTGNDRVLKLSPQGQTLLQILNIDKPAGIALDLAGNIYVSDAKNHQVLKHGPAGLPLAAFALPDNGEPAGLAVDQAGQLYAVDAAGERVVVFSSTGGVARILGGGLFKKPTGVAVSLSGDCVTVADTGNDRVVKFDRLGAVTLTFALEDPLGLALGQDGKLYAAQSKLNRVAVLGLPGAGPALSAVLAPAGYAPSFLTPATPREGNGDLHVYGTEPYITIRFYPGRADSVEISIFSISGQLIRKVTLTAGKMVDYGSGPRYAYEYLWNTSGNRSGIYMITAVAKSAGKADVRKTARVSIK